MHTYTDYEKLFKYPKSRNEIIKEFKLIDKRLIKGELVGVSYSYILGDISFNGKKPNKKKAVKRLMDILNLGFDEITACSKCVYINKKKKK